MSESFLAAGSPITIIVKALAEDLYSRWARTSGFLFVIPSVIIECRGTSRPKFRNRRRDEL